MADSGQMNRQNRYQNQHKDAQTSMQQKEAAVQTAARGAKNGPQVYSMNANTQETQRILAESLTYGVSRKPDIIQRVQVTPDWLGLEENADTLAFANKQSVLMQTSVDSDLNPHLENLQFGIVGKKSDFDKQFEHLKGKDILNEGVSGSKVLELNNADNFNNITTSRNTMNGLVTSDFGSLKVEKAVIGTKFSRTPTEKAAIFINATDTHLETDMTQNRGKSYIYNVRTGPTEISPQTAEIYRFYNANNIKEFSAYMNEIGQPLPYINSQFARISAYEQEKIVMSLAQELYGDTALLKGNGENFVDKMGYLRQQQSETFSEFQTLCDKAFVEYAESKSRTLGAMINYQEPDARNIMDVKRATIQVTDQILNGADYQRNMAEDISNFRESLSRHKITELETAMVERSDSRHQLSDAIKFDLEERINNEKKKELYLQAIKEFKEMQIHNPIQDKNNNEIDDRYEILKELGVSNPERIDSMSLEDINIQINNITSRAIQIVPEDIARTQGTEFTGQEDEKALKEKICNCNKIENINTVLSVLSKIQENHPDNFAVDTKNLYEYGNHDKLVVDMQTMDTISKLKSGLNIPAIRNISYDTLASREACDTAKEQLNKYINEELRVAYHKDSRISNLTNYQSLIDSLDTAKMFSEHVKTEDGKKTLDFKSITDEEIKQASAEFAKSLSETDKNKTIILESAIRAKLTLEVLDQHSHSQDYLFNAELVKQIIDENNRTTILKYVAEHKDEIHEIRNAGRREGLDQSEIIARIEKNITVNCNIPPDEIMRLRQEGTNQFVQNDFLRSEVFNRVSTYGVPENTTFKSFSESCGIQDMKDLEDPRKCKEIITRLDSVIEEMRGIQPVGNSGATTFIDDGRLSAYESIRNTMSQHIVNNNLEQLQAQQLTRISGDERVPISHEIDDKIFQRISYTHKEEELLNKTENVKNVEELTTPYQVYEEHKRLKTIENPSPEMKEVINLLESKLQPTIQDTTSIDGIKDVKYKLSKEQNDAIKQIESSMDEKEAFIKFAIEYENKDDNFNKILKAYEKEFPDSELTKNPEYASFLEKAEEVSWYQIDKYTSFREIEPSLETGKTNPVLLSAYISSFEKENPDIARLLTDDMQKIEHIADRSIQQEIFKENVLQAWRENPGVDMKTFNEYQDTLSAKMRSEAFSAMIQEDENGRIHWNLVEKTDLRAYDTLSAEELLKAREDEKVRASEEIKSIINGQQEANNGRDLSTIQKDLQSVDSLQFGKADIRDILESKSTTSRAVYEIDKTMTNLQYTKLAEETMEKNSMQKDLKVVVDKISEIKRLEEERQNLEEHSHQKASWKMKFLNYIHHGENNPQYDLQKNNLEIERVDKEIERHKQDIRTIGEKYEIKEDSILKVHDKLQELIIEKEDFGKQLQMLEDKYSKATEAPEKPLALWTKEDVSEVIKGQTFDKPLERISYERQLLQDIELAKAYTECKALTEMKQMIEGVQQIRTEHNLNNHEIKQVNYRSLGENIDAIDLNNDLQNKKTIAITAQQQYEQLSELRAHIEQTLTTSGSEHSLKENLEMIKTVKDAHAAFENAANEYNKSLREYQEAMNKKGQVESNELASFIVEANSRERIENRILGESSTGVVIKREEEISVPRESTIIEEYLKAHENSKEYKEVFETEAVERTADKMIENTGIHLDIEETARDKDMGKDAEETEKSVEKSAEKDEEIESEKLEGADIDAFINQ